MWTYDNGLMPASLGLALLSGIALVFLTKEQTTIPLKWQKWFSRFACLLMFIQFVLLLYKPLAQLPTPADRNAGATLLERLRNLPGTVWVFDRSAYALLIGKPFFFTVHPMEM